MRTLAMLGAAFAAGLLGAEPVATQTPPATRDPSPVRADGWGPALRDGLRVSRCAEDCTDARENGNAPAGKAMPLGRDATLTLSAENRLRANRHDNQALRAGDDAGELLWRGVVGADLWLGEHLRAYGELAHGQIEGGPESPPANFDNEAALSQAFVDVRGHVGSMLVGAMVGRQEFADGPRQLVSLGDGPNLHRTWNGARLYLHGESFRIGAHELWATRLDRDAFEEHIDGDERLRGIHVSYRLSHSLRGDGAWLDPFWLHTELPAVRLGDAAEADRRDTLGARLWGRAGEVAFDWMLAHQSGRHGDRGIDAWGLFASQSFAIASEPWQPRLTLHVDVASGGDTDSGSVHTFHQLYASSSYLGEGRFLSLANLILCAPGIALAPTPEIGLSVEYAFARRFSREDAVYGGGMRPYPNTTGGAARGIGGLLRLEGRWTGPAHVEIAVGYERLQRGGALEDADLPGGDHAYVSFTMRY